MYAWQAFGGQKVAFSCELSTVYIRAYAAMATYLCQSQHTEPGRHISTETTVVSRCSDDLYFSQWFFLSTFEFQIRPRTNANREKPIASGR